MRIWPVILDSQPAYLRATADSASLVSSPIGANTLLEHLIAWLEPITRRTPLVVSDDADSPIAELAATCELSDALLIVDARYVPVHAAEYSRLAQRFLADRLVAHHLVAMERAVAGTKECVDFDAAGQVRKIARHYERATWPFITGVPATLVGAASGILGNGSLPASLAELRQMLTARGVLSRDVAIQGQTFDLTEEAGLLAANEHYVRAATRPRGARRRSAEPRYVGTGHVVHREARVTGPVVIHEAAHVEKNAVVVGPAVIGRGARISAGAIITHAVVAGGCTVPAGAVVHNRVWLDASAACPHPGQSRVSYSERLTRLAEDARDHEEGASPDTRGGLRGSHAALKRAFDVTVSIVALTLLSPLLVAIGVAIAIESRGSIFYGDEREGRYGRIFRCKKFRTMYTGAHAAQAELHALDTTDGPHFKIASDPRVTRVGRVLRRLNLDELPQLLNVLSGEMSLVGPRPSPFRENQVCVPWRDARLSVRPGITGFWQVCRHDREAGDFHQWIEYDLLYVQHLSFWLDLRILLATIVTLGGLAGHVPSSWLVTRVTAAPIPDRRRPTPLTALPEPQQVE